jgi:hypothetical protein
VGSTSHTSQSEVQLVCVILPWHGKVATGLSRYLQEYVLAGVVVCFVTWVGNVLYGECSVNTRRAGSHRVTRCAVHALAWCSSVAPGANSWRSAWATDHSALRACVVVPEPFGAVRRDAENAPVNEDSQLHVRVCAVCEERQSTMSTISASASP